jgi:hypothetical protein
MWPFRISSWIWHLISSFSRKKLMYTESLGRGTPGIKSAGCFTLQCTGTTIGEANISLYSIILSTCFCWEEIPHAMILAVVVTFRSNHIEEKYPSLRNHLFSLLRRDERDRGIWDCLWYPVELISQSNNNTTRPRFINNKIFPHIWFSYKNITNFKWGNIT